MKRSLNVDVPTTLNALEKHSAKVQQERETNLSDSYQIKNSDVICVDRGSSKECYKHVGNNRFRVIVDLNLERYKKSKTRKEKSDIVKEIVEAVRCMGGSFIHWKDGEWYDIGNVKAREKASNAIRAALRKSTPQWKHKSSSFSSVASSADTINSQENDQNNDDAPQTASAAALEVQQWHHAGETADDLLFLNSFSTNAMQIPNSQSENRLDGILMHQKKMNNNFKREDP